MTSFDPRKLEDLYGTLYIVELVWGDLFVMTSVSLCDISVPEEVSLDDSECPDGAVGCPLHSAPDFPDIFDDGASIRLCGVFEGEDDDPYLSDEITPCDSLGPAEDEAFERGPNAG